MTFRVGIGFDSHKLSTGHALVIGGINVPHNKGLVGHSDGDVLIHAIMDCLVGARGLGDKGTHFPSSDPELKMTFNEVAEKMLSTGGSVVGNASTNHRRHAPAFATHICDVEVDPDTGKVTILRYTTIQDVGKAIHPSYVEGQ